MKSISETRVGDEVFLACDALALARGTSPGVETVRKALRIAQNTATEGVRAYKENPPPFTRGPVGTSDAALMDRCFRAFDDAEEDAALIYIAPAYVTATDDERRDMRRDAWRAAHVRLCCADLLAERFDALSPSLRPSILAVARQAWEGFTRLGAAPTISGTPDGGSITFGAHARVDPPDFALRAAESVGRFLDAHAEDDAEPFPQRVAAVVRRLNALALDAALEGRYVAFHHADCGWVAFPAGVRDYCAPPVGADAANVTPGMQMLHVEDGVPFLGGFAAGPLLTIEQAARLAGITPPALIGRIRRAENKIVEQAARLDQMKKEAARFAGNAPRELIKRICQAEEEMKPQPFHFEKQPKWRIASARAQWTYFAAWMQDWTGRNAKRPRAEDGHGDPTGSPSRPRGDAG